MLTIVQVAITVSRTPGHRTEESPHCDYWDGDDVADKENRLGGDGDYSDYNGYDVRDVENDGDDFGMACTHGDMLKIFDHIVDSNQRWRWWWCGGRSSMKWASGGCGIY